MPGSACTSDTSPTLGRPEPAHSLGCVDTLMGILGQYRLPSPTEAPKRRSSTEWVNFFSSPNLTDILLAAPRTVGPSFSSRPHVSVAVNRGHRSRQRSRPPPLPPPPPPVGQRSSEGVGDTGVEVTVVILSTRGPKKQPARGRSLGVVPF